VWPDGSVRWLATRGHVQHDAQGRPERFLGVNWDITERKRAEQALRDKAAAEQASRAKSEFLARMSHELRTPLNAVLGFAQLLSADAGDPLSPPQAERVERIRSAGQHLLALIDDVLDLASIESSGMPLAHEAVPLQAALHDVLQWTRLQADEAGVSVQAETTTAQVLGDPRRVRQVIANLMSNAIKYNRAGGHVWLAVERGAWQGVPAWAITVRDDGRGMSAAQRRHLFEPFNRLGAEREAIQGTGIGLAIVHHLVKLMRGEIGVESEPGRGSAFRIVLRAAAGTAAEPAQQAVPSSAEAAPVSTTAAAPLRLLYIEDNPVNVLLVQELLANHAHVELAVAVDGLSGVRLAQHARPDVVLVDMQLPDIDGTEVLRRLRADPELAGLTIVALSANAMPEDVSRAREAGFDDYWTKPIDFKAFLAALHRLAQARQPGADQGARRSRSQLPSASR
jgi:signal transduction histidine kinase/ActR/RegA family two-component response regulator